MSTWVLLRGLTRESGHWAGFEQQLRQRLTAVEGGARVVAIDLPGNGTAHHRKSPTRIAAMTDDCRAQLHALGLAPPYRLVAMSMGAMVAVDWATRDAASVAGCVLINTSLRGIAPWHWRLRPANLFTLLRVASMPLSAADKEATILKLTSHNAAAARAVLDAWTALRSGHPVSRLNALRQLLAAARARAPLRAPRVPLLVLASRCDALVDSRCSQRLAARWNAPIEWHPWAGHDLPLDDGRWVAERIAEWVVRPRQVSTQSRG
ncbi:alpha/beta hydrolase [soil metagenome]